MFFDDMAMEPSAQVDAADLDGDGFIDVVFACGDGMVEGAPNDIRPQRYLHNADGTGLEDGTIVGFTDQDLHGRAIKARDIDRDGDIDIVLGTTWQSQSQLYLNDGAGTFTLGTAGLPKLLASVGDLEIGDVDGDDDLDIVLIDWGAVEPVDGFDTGGRTMLWLQEGTATFVDATAPQMPDKLLSYARDVDLVDVDDDFDLDIVIACEGCPTEEVQLFINDGVGVFTSKMIGIGPVQFNAPRAIEPMHIDGDDALDLLLLDPSEGVGSYVFINVQGVFTDQTDTYWPAPDNTSKPDEAVAFIDFNADAAPDFVLLSKFIQEPDRVVVNQGGGMFLSDGTVLDEPVPSLGSSSLVFARLDGDDEPDIVMAQNQDAVAKVVLLATDEFLADTVPPRLSNVDAPAMVSFPGTAEFRVRCHDYKSPLMLHDFEEPTGYPYVESWPGDPGDPDVNPGVKSEPGRWYGEYLWRITADVPDHETMWYRLCAIDYVGNMGCTGLMQAAVEGATGTGTGGESSTGGSSGGAIDTSGGVATTGVSPTGTGGVETTGVMPTTTAPQGGTSGGSEGSGGEEIEPGGCGCAANGTPLWALVVLGVRRRRARVSGARGP